MRRFQDLQQFETLGTCTTSLVARKDNQFSRYQTNYSVSPYRKDHSAKIVQTPKKIKTKQCYIDMPATLEKRAT
jgi:hypothetical protein